MVSLGQQGMQQLQLSSPDSLVLLKPPGNGLWLLFIVCKGKSLLLDLLLLPRWTWTEVARLPTVSLLPGSHASTGWTLKLSVLFRQGTFKGQHAIRKLLFCMRGDLWGRQYARSRLMRLPVERKAGFAGEKGSLVLFREQCGRGALLLQLQSGLQGREKLKVSTEPVEPGKGSRRALSS